MENDAEDGQDEILGEDGEELVPGISQSEEPPIGNKPKPNSYLQSNKQDLIANRPLAVSNSGLRGVDAYNQNGFQNFQQNGV